MKTTNQVFINWGLKLIERKVENLQPPSPTIEIKAMNASKTLAAVDFIFGSLIYPQLQLASGKPDIGTLGWQSLLLHQIVELVQFYL